MSTRERFRAGSDDVLEAELLVGKSIKDAAKAAGMSYATARRRLDEAEFRERLEAARGDLREGMVRHLEAAVARAIGCLDDLAQNAETDTARIAAARALVQHMPGVMTTAEIRGRLEEIERAQGTDPRTSWKRSAA